MGTEREKEIPIMGFHAMLDFIFNTSIIGSLINLW